MSGPILGNDSKGPMSQQALQALECVICSEEYGNDFHHVPRSLKCGHTHCTKCLHVMMTAKGVKCPICSTWHEVNRPDVTQLPPNITIIEILMEKMENMQAPVSVQPLCGVCSINPATIACIDCQPGTPFKFCEDCDNREHNRNFGPVHRHRRFPADRVPVTSSFVCCSRHRTNKAVFFSEKHNEFACNTCESQSDWQIRREHFKVVSSSAQMVRSKLQTLNQSTRDIIGKLAESKLRLEGIIHELGPSASTAKTQIATKFGEIVHQIQSRKQKLLDTVEKECTSRQLCLEQQLLEIQEANKEFTDAHEEVNSLIPKNDFDFLTSYSPLVEKVEQLILNENRSLQRPLAHHEIPLIISKELLERMGSLGAIGGGKTPIKLAVKPTWNKCDLLYLNWELPEDCGMISNFEIEIEQIYEDLASALGSDNHGLRYIQKEPRYQKVPGKELRVYADFLCPGFKYKYKVRSSNAAGWGTWSKAVSGACKNFPLHIGYTKRIHRICIPFSAHYRITAQGAKAADGETGKGGRGAIISATFSLKAGDILIILCGGMSSANCSSGGGGGTFVARNEITLENLLIAAGGGGGTRGLDSEDGDGMDASLDENGSDGQGYEHGNGGLNGDPGKDASLPEFRGPCWGYGGAGFLKNSTTASSFLDEGHGGQCGGYGGGGAIGSFGGGGGGGFSGGGGGRGGGGGGSYVHPTLATNVKKSLGNEGAGSIVVEKADAPYPDDSKSYVTRVDSCVDSSGYGTLETPTLQSFSSQSSSTDNRGRYDSQTSSTHPSSGEVTLDSSKNVVNPSSQHSSPGSTATISTIGSNSTAVTLVERDESAVPNSNLQPIQEVMVRQLQGNYESTPVFLEHSQAPSTAYENPSPHQEKNNALPKLNPKPVQEVAVVCMSANLQTPMLAPQPHYDQQAPATNVQQMVQAYPYEQPRNPHPSQLPVHYSSEPHGPVSQHGNVQEQHYRPDVKEDFPFHQSLSQPTLTANQPPIQRQPPAVLLPERPGIPPASTVFATQAIPIGQLHQPQFQHDVAQTNPVFDPRQNQLPLSHSQSAVKDMTSYSTVGSHNPASSHNALQNRPHQ